MLLATFVLNCHGTISEKKVHIVYVGEKSVGGTDSIASTHHSMLANVLGSGSSAKESLFYSYWKGFHGFAAKLTDEEVSRFREMDGVVSVFPSQKLNLHTTRSWDFISSSVEKVSAGQQGDIIIGMIDSGIWPEHESFDDEGFTPPPARWKGECTGENFTCNNKIIGARSYNYGGTYWPKDDKSARDTEGHGTHTASTAAGRKVNASYYGLASGIARGGAQNARIAVYKVCWSFGCYDADILKGFDDAIADGVDIISTSLGPFLVQDYLRDSIAIGSFHAMRHGILTSASASNDGPFPYSVKNIAPWTLTVAASTIDRKFVSQLVTGDGRVYNGLSVNNFDLKEKTYPLIWGGDARNVSAGFPSSFSSLCNTGTLNTDKVAGKIVVCERDAYSSVNIKNAKGVGTIVLGDFPNVARGYSSPVTAVTSEEIADLKTYILSSENPVATILPSETPKDVRAPYVIDFSSRGPNPLTPDILKPDLTAPGVDIIAAWSPASPPGYEIDPLDTRSVKFNVISGTSMSCPHVTGAAAYVKSAHPNWSPAAVKSALMTTAKIMDPSKNDDREFAYGAGHLDLEKALHPGLVYDATEADYVNFLCKQGYNSSTVGYVTGTNTTVCHSTKLGRAWDLNYPSFAVAVEDGHKINALFTRTVTNVGLANSTYKVSWQVPSGVNLSVEPQVLNFSKIGEKHSYTVKVTGPAISQKPIKSGAITWSDGKHIVRSPIVVHTVLPGAIYPSIPQLGL